MACAAVVQPPFALADALGQRAQQRTKEAAPLGTHLIVPGSDDPDFDGVTFRCAAIVSSAPALVRTLSAKRSGRLEGYYRLVTTFACNYSDLSVVLIYN